MKSKHARLTVLIAADTKQAFDALCASRGMTTSQQVRQLMSDYIAKQNAQVGQPSAFEQVVHTRASR